MNAYLIMGIYKGSLFKQLLTQTTAMSSTKSVQCRAGYLIFLELTT